MRGVTENPRQVYPRHREALQLPLRWGGAWAERRCTGREGCGVLTSRSRRDRPSSMAIKAVRLKSIIFLTANALAVSQLTGIRPGQAHDTAA
jgi:hypothetical protein